MKKIGIIGNGFVGSSVRFGFSPQTGCEASVKIYDVNDLYKLKDCDIVFQI